MPGIIKSGTLDAQQQLKGNAPNFRFQDFEQKAEEYSQKIYDEGQQIIEKAKQEAEEIRQKAKEEARQDALREVRNEFQAQQQTQMNSIAPMVHSAIEQLKDGVHKFQLDWERKTVSLALQIAEKVIKRELQSQPEIALDQLRAALQLCGNQDEIFVHVNPTDQKDLGPAMESVVNHFGLLSKTTIVPDTLVGSGGCVVRTIYGQIDAQIESQLERIEEELSQ